MIRFKMQVPKAKTVNKILNRNRLTNPNCKTFIQNSKTPAEMAKSDPFMEKALPSFNENPYVLPMRKVTDPIIIKDSKHPFDPLKDYRGKSAVKEKEVRVAAGSPPPPPPGGNGGGNDPNDINNILNDLNKNLNKNRAKTSYDIQKFRNLKEKFDLTNKINYKPMTFKNGINEEIRMRYNNTYKK